MNEEITEVLQLALHAKTMAERYARLYKESGKKHDRIWLEKWQDRFNQRMEEAAALIN